MGSVPRFWITASVMLLAGVCLVACGSGTPQAGASQPAAATANAPAPAAPSSSGGTPADITSYLHEQLVTNGEDVQSDFGSALLTLGMNPRDLQQDTPDHAYHTALEKVRDVPDGAARREMLRTLFGTDEPR